MKIKDIADQYGLNIDSFERFLDNSSHRVRRNISGSSLDDSENISAIVDEFIIYEEYKVGSSDGQFREKLEQLKAKKTAYEKAVAGKKDALANMLITSGFSFDGYTITKYSGYISGDDAISVDRGWAIFGIGINVKDRLLGTLVEIRRNALAELKEAAYALGCNAVIGVDFDYLTLDPQTANLTGGTTYQPYVFAVTANGNAVIIEKNE